jgi:acetyl esterase/lipase
MAKPCAGILDIHGGGYVIGAPEMGRPAHESLVAELGCIIVTVDYRLAPETAFPGAVEDCYAALKWFHQQAEGLGVDRTRIGVTGTSAGGGLAAALAVYVRDKGESLLAFQHLIYPMIDDRTCVRQPNPHVGQHVWTHRDNHFGWKSLLGVEPGSAGVSAHAAAARAEDLSRLPPTYVAVGALDLFLQENLDYVNRLAHAGVPVEAHVYPGAYHGFHIAQQATVARTAERDSRAALARFCR